MILKYSRYSLIILLVTAVNTGLTLAMPYFNAQIIDEGIMAGNLQAFFLLTVIYLFIYLAEVLVKMFSARISAKYSNIVKKDFMTASASYFLASTDEAVTRAQAHNVITKEINLLQNCLFSMPVGIAGNIISFILSIVFLWHFTKHFTIPIIALCLISVIIRNKLSGVLQNLNTVLYNVTLQLNTKQMEFLDYFKTARLIHAIPFIRRRLSDNYSNYLATEYGAYCLHQKVNVLSGINDQFLSMGIMVFTGYQVIHKKMTVGMMFSISRYTSQLLSSISQILSQVNFLYANRCELENMVEILWTSQAMYGTAGTRPSPGCDEIQLRRLFFRYPNGHAIFADISLIFNKGTINFITGSSGAGKTTLFKLLTQEIKPDKGSITAAFDDIYLVPQTAIIFSETVKDNIILDQPYDLDKLNRVCQECRIYEEIQAMPLAYETRISDQAVNISAGQKQRICLARALYFDKQILILDEPTANIDWPNAQNIISFLSTYAKTHLVIVITHSSNLITKGSKKFTISKLKIEEVII